MKKFAMLLNFFVIAGLTVFVFTSLAASETNAVRGTKPIKIAVHFSTTGWSKSLGVEELQGARLAIHQINTEGGIHGRNLEPIITDIQSDYTFAVTIAKKMAANTEIVAAIGDATSGISMAMKPVYYEAHLPVIAPVRAGPYTQGDFDYAYRCIDNGDFAVPVFLKLWKDSLGIKTISILHTADAWGENAAKILEKTAPKLGIKILSRNSYQPTAIDVTAQLIRAKAANPDALVVWGYGEPVINVYKGTKQIGMKAQILGPGGILDARITMAVPKECAGTIIADAMSVDDPVTDVHKKFVAAYRSMYPGEQFTTFSGCAWDGVQIIGEALKKVVKGDEPVNREQLKKALDKTDFFGTQGHYKFSSTHHDGPIEPYLFVAKLVDGKIKLLLLQK